MIKRQVFFLWGQLKPGRKRQLMLLSVLALLASFMEAVSIGAIIPFLGALTSPDILMENHYVQTLIGWCEFETQEDLLGFFAVSFAIGKNSFVSMLFDIVLTSNL